MNKVYSRINWRNYPSQDTALNETNLNRIDKAVDDIDNRIISQDTEKVSHSEISNNIKSWTMDETTGIITITHYDDSKTIFDLNIEKIPISFSLSDDGILTMTTSDGTKFTANIGAMIPILTFSDSDTIAVTISGEGINKTYSFTVKTGSITEDKLQPNFLADIKVESSKAIKAANDASVSEVNAKNSEESAKTSEANSEQSAINAKTSEENAKQSEINAQTYKNSAETFKNNALTYKNDAEASKNSASLSETNAKLSEGNAKQSEENAKSSETKAKNSADSAEISKNTARDIKEESESILQEEKDILAEAKRIINPPEVMKGATIDTDGTEGLVPKPKATNYRDFLRGDGTWQKVDMSEKANGRGISFDFRDGKLYMTYSLIETDEITDLVDAIYDNDPSNDVKKDDETYDIIENIYDGDESNDAPQDADIDEILREIYKQ